MKTMETVHTRTRTGTRIEKVEHDWEKQCSWVHQDGSHCPNVKMAGSDLCSVHRCVAG